MLSPELRCLGLSGQVEKRSLRRRAHSGGNTGVSEPSMTSPWIPRLGAISVLAPGSPVRPRGARRGLIENRQHAPPLGKRIRQTASRLVDSSRHPSGRRGGPGSGCIRSFGGGCALLLGIGGFRSSRW
jgi:hypothetical protein